MGFIIRNIILIVVLTGCAINANAGEWEIEAAGGFDKVIKYVPDTASPVGQGRSLLIVLHGCTQGIENYKNANLDRAAEEYGAVIAVPDAKHKEGFSCWGYWTGRKSRNVGDYKNVINLAKQYMQDYELDIDPNQVYLAGLSSGGTFAMQTWCLAPDVFAGVAAVGAPYIGQQINGGGIGFPPSPEQTAERCISYSGSYSDYFAGQKVSIAYGTSDYTVPQSSSKHSAEALAIVVGAEKSEGVTIIDGRAEETIWKTRDGIAAVSLLGLRGVSHAWPGGEGAVGSYIDDSNINYTEYIAEFLTKNNPYPKCKININGFELDDHYALGRWDKFNVKGDVSVEGDCGLKSISIQLDEEVREDLWQFVDEDFAIEPGNHKLELQVSAVRNDGSVVVKRKNWNFSSEIKIPSWCQYWDKKYWKWIPSCAPGIQ